MEFTLGVILLTTMALAAVGAALAVVIAVTTRSIIRQQALEFKSDEEFRKLMSAADKSTKKGQTNG